MKIVLGVLAFILLGSCSKEKLNEETASKYYDKIATGDNVGAEDYLSANFQYEDVIFKQEYSSRTDYIKTLALDTAKHYRCDKILELENISAINDSTVFVKGEYCGYNYKGKEVNPNRFVSLLYFNKQGTIHRQEDWIDHSLEGILNMYQFRSSFITGGN